MVFLKTGCEGIEIASFFTNHKESLLYTCDGDEEYMYCQDYYLMQIKMNSQHCVSFEPTLCHSFVISFMPRCP